MKRFLTSLVVVTLLGGAVGCHRPVTITTAPGRAAYTADMVALRVNELMNAAIAANAAVPPGVPTATARQIVDFCVKADQTLAAIPSGWQQTLQVAWMGAKAKIGVPTNPAIVAAMGAVDVVLGVTQ